MINADNETRSPQEQIDELRNILADVLPELVAYYHQQKVKTDLSAVHQGKAAELQGLINRVARHVGNKAIDG